ncbi:hypothetical protein O1611_g10278 [Lasiodiplodia mahajangana]|uniref:Uncharacterized protein n=1 Tax=Lasiodiplodia mahajangana TaxID=1108764 RepID=A0ACC2IZW9_9PEZI|nr:hypothetical protein O1611_g10278 [Lasiodiplodia mahajangana]
MDNDAKRTMLPLTTPSLRTADEKAISSDKTHSTLPQQAMPPRKTTILSIRSIFSVLNLDALILGAQELGG